jgi:glyceraldehyde-3-phosphate dehydrogenase/erythrose-4-phosphate dehydrogenase
LDKAFAENIVTKTTHHAKHIKKVTEEGEEWFSNPTLLPRA